MSKKEQPCGFNLGKSIKIDIRGENTEDTINKFMNEFKEKIKEVNSNMIILSCQILPISFFDLD